jgi:hypothetical protein
VRSRRNAPSSDKALAAIELREKSDRVSLAEAEVAALRAGLDARVQDVLGE